MMRKILLAAAMVGFVSVIKPGFAGPPGPPPQYLLTDLGDLAPFLTLTSASGINESGWIAATGVDSRTGATHAYLLKPTK